MKQYIVTAINQHTGEILYHQRIETKAHAVLCAESIFDDWTYVNGGKLPKHLTATVYDAEKQEIIYVETTTDVRWPQVA